MIAAQLALDILVQDEDIDATRVRTVKEFDVRPVGRWRVEPFIERWHYSGNMNGVKSRYCFGLYWGHRLIGAAVLAEPATMGVERAYDENGTLQVIELRRLVCIDKTPKNTESYFVGKVLRWLRRYTDIDVVLAYSDETYGHVGIVYRASNFKLVNVVEPIQVIEYGGRLYHDRSLRVRYRGRFKPFSQRLRHALESGEARRVDSGRKFAYVYQIARHTSREKRIEQDQLQAALQGMLL